MEKAKTFYLGNMIHWMIDGLDAYKVLEQCPYEPFEDFDFLFKLYKLGRKLGYCMVLRNFLFSVKKNLEGKVRSFYAFCLSSIMNDFGKSWWKESGLVCNDKYKNFIYVDKRKMHKYMPKDIKKANIRERDRFFFNIFFNAKVKIKNFKYIGNREDEIYILDDTGDYFDGKVYLPIGFFVYKWQFSDDLEIVNFDEKIFYDRKI